MFSLRTHALITGGLFALIIAMAIVGNALQASGIVKHPEALQTPMRIVFFTIFIVFAFSLVPTLVKVFVAGQGAIGNADKGFIQLIARHQVGVIFAIWGIWILGIAVALPTMISSGFFTDLGGGTSPTTSGAGNSDAEIAKEIAAMPVQGTLVAAPGMTVAEMRSGSSLKIDPSRRLASVCRRRDLQFPHRRHRNRISSMPLLLHNYRHQGPEPYRLDQRRHCAGEDDACAARRSQC